MDQSVMRRKRANGEAGSGGGLSRRRWIIALFMGLEAALLLLGWCFLFIGNGLVLAVVPLLALVLSRRSERESFKRPTWSLLLSNVVVVALLVGAGMWFLLDLGFAAQNLICMALRSQ